MCGSYPTCHNYTNRKLLGIDMYVTVVKIDGYTLLKAKIDASAYDRSPLRYNPLIEITYIDSYRGDYNCQMPKFSGAHVNDINNSKARLGCVKCPGYNFGELCDMHVQQLREGSPSA